MPIRYLHDRHARLTDDQAARLLHAVLRSPAEEYLPHPLRDAVADAFEALGGKLCGWCFELASSVRGAP